MRTELKEVLQDKLDSYVSEYLNEQAKGSEGISIANPELRYYKGYIDGMCCALNCKSWGLEWGVENDRWVIRDSHNRIVASSKNAWDDED
jgi:hypothetical protein